MIPRYSRPEMVAVWSDAARFARWLEVELLATEAHAAIGVVPSEDAASCRSSAPVVNDAFVEAVADRERVTDHDVAAFVDVVHDAIGLPAGSWIHYGLTSSDVVDTALGWAMRDAALVLDRAIGELVDTVAALARRHRRTAMIGRTHGVHAEPTTFGVKAALWALQLDRDRTRLRAATESVSVAKLSGAVGTFSNIDPAVERHVAAALGLTSVPATQVIARDRHAELLYACASIAATCELVAVELRHLQRTEVAEVLEGFKAGQKGSSAMPHKRNPISAETISGLARVVRSNLLAGVQDFALWHERDISHSSVERIILPDSTTLAHYCLWRLDRLLQNLVVDEDQMRRNIMSSHGLVFSQPVLLALVSAGMPRDDAYRVVQRNAARSWDERLGFRDLLEQDPDVELDGDALDAAFDLDRSLRHVDRIVDAVDAIANR
ncbi:adenylosuccinate lyase [soil metagenome]